MAVIRSGGVSLLVLAIGSTMAVFASSALAQDAAAAQPWQGQIEEILVTARKREQSLQDVSLSVSVVSGERLDQLGITRLDVATQLIPSVSVVPGPTGDNLFVRGMGSGLNQGFEMSVATFIDGVHYGRGRSSRQPFLDVERIEVLKGPQPILFGKNTIGGAFNITTRRPTSEREAMVSAYWEPEFNTFQTTGVLSGPVSDDLALRLVGRRDVSEGYMKNTLTGEDEVERDDWALRGVAVWTPRDDVVATFKGERNVSRRTGGLSQITRASPMFASMIQAIDPNAEFRLDHQKSGAGTFAPFDREFDDNKAYAGTLTVEWDADAFVLTSISSYHGYDVDYTFDPDFSPLDLIIQAWDQGYKAWSQELRVDWTSGDSLQYTAGLYYAREDLDSARQMSFNFTAVPPLAGLGTSKRHQRFQQDTDTWSAFGQLTWNAAEDLAVIAGLRYTDDRKKAKKDLYWSQIDSEEPDPAVGALFSSIGLGVPHDFGDLKRDTTDLSGGLTFEYHGSNVMYYVSYTRGFKAGGFDEASITGVLDEIPFDDETVNSVEAGLKSRLLNDTATVNLAIFESRYKDLQVSAFDGVAALLVGNAAKATTRGVELEGRWVVSERLRLLSSLSWLDARYDSYPEGPCYVGQPGPSCDLSDERIQFAPKWSGSFSADWDDALAGQWRYSIAGEAVYSDRFFTSGNLNPTLAQDSFWKANARISVYTVDGAWEIAAVGNNLFDKTTAHFGENVPLANLLGDNTQQYVDPPRTVGLQVRYRFAQ
jgi:iron complex outermembrane recepter protein